MAAKGLTKVVDSDKPDLSLATNSLSIGREWRENMLAIETVTSKPTATGNPESAKANTPWGCRNFQGNRGFEHMLGHSPALVGVRQQAARAAGTNCTIPIQGETGTGKERLACGIHANSKRCETPFASRHEATGHAQLVHGHLQHLTHHECPSCGPDARPKPL